jgi:hypothetical protein
MAALVMPVTTGLVQLIKALDGVLAGTYVNTSFPHTAGGVNELVRIGNALTVTGTGDDGLLQPKVLVAFTT